VARETVDRVLRGYELFNSGDLDAAMDGFHPDIEWVGTDVLPENETRRGHDEVRRFWESWREVFDDFRIEIEEIVDAGDQVIVMARVSGRGRDSGAEVVTPSFAHIWTLRDELVVRMEMLPTRADALRAVGLEGQTG
jgi:uncharacterized protein